MYKTALGILSLILVASTATIASANHHGAGKNPCAAHHPCGMKNPHKGYHHGMMGGYGNYNKEALVKTLGLSDAQREKVKAIWNKTKETIKTKAAKLREEGSNIGKALAMNNPCFAKARAASAAVIDIEKEIKALYLDATEATYKLLNDKQKAKWSDAMKAFHDSQYGHGKGMMGAHHGMNMKKKDCPLKGTKDCPDAKK